MGYQYHHGWQHALTLVVRGCDAWAGPCHRGRGPENQMHMPKAFKPCLPDLLTPSVGGTKRWLEPAHNLAAPGILGGQPGNSCPCESQGTSGGPRGRVSGGLTLYKAISPPPPCGSLQGLGPGSR